MGGATAGAGLRCVVDCVGSRGCLFGGQVESRDPARRAGAGGGTAHNSVEEGRRARRCRDGNLRRSLRSGIFHRCVY